MSADNKQVPTDVPVLSETPAGTEVSQTADKQATSLTFWQVAGVALLVSAMVMISTLAGYHVYFARANKAKALGTVDLQQVLQLKEMTLNELLTRPGTTDADREKAYDLLKGLDSEITRAIDELRVECNCNILVKAAVIGNGDINLTDALKAKLGIGSASPDDLQKKVHNNTFGGAQGQLGQQPAPAKDPQ
jgi:hypothetical protein